MNNNGVKPRGFWYQINDCLFEWGELDWGKYVYEVKLKRSVFTGLSSKNINKILVIKNLDELIKFDKKYGYNYDYYDKEDKKNMKMRFVKWGLVALYYGGFEIKNFVKIHSQGMKSKDFFRKLMWFDSFDFSSGCIWNLDIIKEVNYFGIFNLK